MTGPLAAALAGGAVLLARGPRPATVVRLGAAGPESRHVGPEEPVRGHRSRRWVFAGGAVAALLWVVVGALPACLAVGVGPAVLRGRRRRTATRAGVLAGERAAEACGVLVEELAAGRTGRDALDAACDVDPALAAVGRAAQAGADVPTALRAVGVPAYAVLASAWQVAEQHGVGLADACSRVVQHLRAERATARVVAAELASARATARLLLALPVLALVGGALTGGRPWEFLFGHGLGQVCLASGVGLAATGLRWIDAIASEGDAVGAVGAGAVGAR